MKVTSIVSPEDQSVTFVELFFDLVFVFSITQVVGLLHEGITGGAVARAVLVFWLVWWAWTQFTWALNAANTDHSRIQLSTLLATAIAFFMAVSVPEIFAGGPLWFAVPYVLVRVLGLRLYAWVSSADASQRSAVRTFGLVSVGGLAAVLTGAVLGGDLLYWFWGLAIVLDVVAAAVGGQTEGWNLHPAHFAERHGLIVIIALGESLIVAAGGLIGAERSADLMAVAVLAVALSCGLWWSYFPYIKPQLEHALKNCDGAGQPKMARDVFSLAHFPMLCGVIGFAAAIEEAIAHPDHPLSVEGRAALAVGLGLFLAGTALAQWRAVGTLSLGRVGLVAALVVGILALGSVPPWVSLALGLAGIAAVVIVEHRALGQISRKERSVAEV